MRRVAKWCGGVLLVLLLLAGLAIAIGPPKIPAEAIASSVNRSPNLLERAFALPVASTFGRDLHWQSNGSTCGPASLVNVRRSFGLVAAGESEVLDGTGFCWTGACIPGVTLDQLAEIGQSRGDLSIVVARDLDDADFQRHLRKSNDPSRRYVINFSRKPIFGSGGGHHSPIAGYLESEDLVLVLDVNQDFKPWLIKRPRLFAAMDTVDSSTEKKRGLLVVTRSQPRSTAP